MNRLFSIGLVTLLLCCGSSRAEISYERVIQPILEDRCIDCHGPDKQKSELRVDQRAVLLRGGDSGLASVVPGDTKKSYLLELIQSDDEDQRMPPKGKRLTKEQIAALETWIAEGAQWPGQMESAKASMKGADHWAYKPVKRPAVPDGAEHPVDAFLLAAMRQQGVEPNAGADPRTLIRRASMVLTGLPPLPDRVRAFEKDHAANPDAAYEKLVDELLASPHFGERWAQHWLDVIRWAETNGSESNLYRKNAWMYRDYVIRAFNEDKPYNQFVREQISGDAMGAGDATGFLVAGPHVPAATVGREPTAIRQARADRLDEVMQTVGASMMGVTIGCARCHNHKFDPVSIKDYYAMSAVFQGLEFGSRFPELAEDHPRRLRGQELWKEIGRERSVAREQGPWEEDWGGYREVHFPPIKTKVFRISFWSPHVRFDEVELFGAPGEPRNFALASEGTQVRHPEHLLTRASAKIDYVNDGEYGTMAWAAKSAKNAKEKPWLEFHFTDARELSRIRMSSNREYFFETDYLTVKTQMAYHHFRITYQNQDGQWQTLTDTAAMKKATEASPERQQALGVLQKQIAEMAELGPRKSFLGRFEKPKPTKVLLRGSPENPRDEVAAAGPAILRGDLGLAFEAPERKRRVEFANWLAQPDHPLTSRVMVNRVWHHVFGSGIVPTTSDFGAAGAPSSHPELLDWLADEFLRELAWSPKQLIKLLVTSDAFKRSSRPAPESLAKDAGAVLLWRFPPRRAEAEVIRDAILQASGKLDRQIGGRSYRIHNVKKTYAQWEVVNNHGPDTWRRMIYQERMRRVDDKMFTAFDFPDCGQIRAKRPVSTTPLQALNLMNSPFAVEQASLLAAETKDLKDPEARVRDLFQRLLNRDPDSDELQACLAVAKENGLPMVCRSLINCNEFAFIP